MDKASSHGKRFLWGSAILMIALLRTPLVLSGPPGSTLRTYKRTDWFARTQAADPRAFSSAPQDSTLRPHHPDTWSVKRLRRYEESKLNEDKSTLKSHRAPRAMSRYDRLRKQYTERVQRYRKIQKAMREMGHEAVAKMYEESIRRETRYFDRKVRTLDLEPEK